MEVKQVERASNAFQVHLYKKGVKGGKDALLKSMIEAFEQDEKLEFLESKLPQQHYFLIRGGLDAEKLRVHGSKVRGLLDKKVEYLSFFGKEEELFFVIEGFMLASYQYLKHFKDAEERSYKLKAILVDDQFDRSKIDELHHIYTMVQWTRDRVNEPFSHLNAVQLASSISELGEQVGFSVKVLQKAQLESLKMGGILAVNKGSVDPPTFTIIEYKPKKCKNKKPVVLVGKGVVYDTGGLSLKPTPNSMDVMKSDMAGAAAVAGAIALVALQELPAHVIGLIPATDNRPGLAAYAPGDVITMYDGTTVEVLNTDAEGRMILADALAYANKFDPELVLDAATLTGAALRAIGEHASIVMGNAPDSYFDKLEKAGEHCFERVVRFPFWSEYLEEMKSSIADLKNIGGPNAGMITAGKFLEHFVKAPYIHMDIAGSAWLDRASAYRSKGGSGAGVRLLYHFIKDLSNGK